MKGYYSLRETTKLVIMGQQGPVTRPSPNAYSLLSLFSKERWA